MTILNDIVENTRAKLESKKAELPLAEIISKLNELNLPKGAFKESLLNKDQALSNHEPLLGNLILMIQPNLQKI